MIRKIRNLKFVIRNCKAGMTYVELIVVLSIFAALSSVVIFNYGIFQDKVDIKNLASDIALKIVEAQKASMNGVLPATGSFGNNKPAYGVNFDINTNNKQFIYFADLNDNYQYNESAIDTVNITKNNIISYIDRCSVDPCTPGSNSINPLTITFQRPDSKANFFTNLLLTFTGSEYVQITIKSPKDAKAYIKIYPSGRVQVN